ncbi:MAG TPA: redoxin domain-containing protein [Anaerolineales bacterium]|nr:redoxin domain-containing protein [Anaerolineales bacterium]
MNKIIAAGEMAPTFELKDIDGKLICLSDFYGKPVLLAFLRGFM